MARRFSNRKFTHSDLAACEWALWQPTFDSDITEPDLTAPPKRFEVRVVEYQPIPRMVLIRGFKIEDVAGYAHLNVDERILTVPFSEIYYAEPKNSNRREYPFPHHCNYHGLAIEPTNRRGMGGKLGTFSECPYPGCDVGKWSNATDSHPADGETRAARRHLFELFQELVRQSRYSDRGSSIVRAVQLKGGIGRLSFTECRTFIEQLESPRPVFSEPELTTNMQVSGRPIGQPREHSRPFITMEPTVRQHRCPNCGRGDVALSRTTGWCARCSDITNYVSAETAKTSKKPRKAKAKPAPPQPQFIRDIEID